MVRKAVLRLLALFLLWSIGASSDLGIGPLSFYGGSPFLVIFIFSLFFRTCLALFGTYLIIGYRMMKKLKRSIILAILLCGMPLITMSIMVTEALTGIEDSILLYPFHFLSYFVKLLPDASSQAIVGSTLLVMCIALLYELPKQLLHVYFCAVWDRLLHHRID